MAATKLKKFRCCPVSHLKLVYFVYEASLNTKSNEIQDFSLTLKRLRKKDEGVNDNLFESYHFPSLILKLQLKSKLNLTDFCPSLSKRSVEICFSSNLNFFTDAANQEDAKWLGIFYIQ